MSDSRSEGPVYRLKPYRMPARVFEGRTGDARGITSGRPPPNRPTLRCGRAPLRQLIDCRVERPAHAAAYAAAPSLVMAQRGITSTPLPLATFGGRSRGSSLPPEWAFLFPHCGAGNRTYTSGSSFLFLAPHIFFSCASHIFLVCEYCFLAIIC